MKSKHKPRGFWQKKENVFKYGRGFENVSSFEGVYPAAVLSARNNGWVAELKTILSRGERGRQLVKLSKA